MTIKQKNRALLIGLAVLLFVAYQFSFKKTFELKDTINRLTADKVQLDNAGGRLQFLQQQNAYLDSILQSNDLSANQTFEQNLLQKVNRLREAHKVKLLSLTEPHKYQADGAIVESYTLEVKGDFRNLMLFSNELEKQRLGKFASVDFEKKRNYKTRRNELICRIILQRLSK